MLKCFFILLLSFFLVSCAGYKPVYNSNNFNFFVEDIVYANNSSVSREIVKKLKSFNNTGNKKPIQIKLISSKNEDVIARDSKGDPSTFEFKIEVQMIVSNEDYNEKFIYKEIITFNNQTNKFELKQYKKNIEKNLVDNIIKQIFINLTQIK